MALTLKTAIKEGLAVGVIAVAMYHYIDFTTDKNIEGIKKEEQQSIAYPQGNAGFSEKAINAKAYTPQIEKKAVQKPVKTAQNSFPSIIPTIDVKGHRPVRMNGDASCLSVNSYFENRSRSDATLEHTMWTVRNRVGRYYNQTVCDAVLNAIYDEKGVTPLKETAHYSWVADGKQMIKIGYTQADMQRWERSLVIAKKVATANASADPTGGATHYHLIGTKPWWTASKDMKHLYDFDGNSYYRGW